MDNKTHTVLCVDDEKNVLNALRRLSRKENYNLITADSGIKGLEILKETPVHLVICDQRMPDMSGTDFLAIVKELYPHIIRITLSGYTEIEAIKNAINKGHIYKFLLKPWNDDNLLQEIRTGLEHYDLVQTNQVLNEKLVMKNEALEQINKNLESLVDERTEDLRIRNHVLELARALLDSLPVPILGVGADGVIVMNNQSMVHTLGHISELELGRPIQDFFSPEVCKWMYGIMNNDRIEKPIPYDFSDVPYIIHCSALSGKFKGKGAVLTLQQAEK